MSRLDEIATAFLRYLYASSYLRPDITPFLDDPAEASGAYPVTAGELGRVLAWLRHSELITLGGVSEDGVSARAGLTGEGLICAGHHHGDVHAWARARTSTAVPQQRPTREETTPEEPEAPPDSSHCRRASTAGLARVTRVLLLTLPVLSADRAERGIQRTARHLLEATQDPAADTQRIRQLACGLRSELETGPLARTLGAVLLDGFDEALHESHLG